jgi:WD40 repeat protein
MPALACNAWPWRGAPALGLAFARMRSGVATGCRTRRNRMGGKALSDISITAVSRWTGRESRALREALRLSVRDFASRLGVTDRMVSKWETGGETICPRPVNQEALDSMLAGCSGDARARFHLFLDHGSLSASGRRDAGADPMAQQPGRGHTPRRSQRQLNGGYALVPPRDGDVVDRRDELEKLVVSIVGASTCSGVVGVCGPGGFGKTTLATEACHDERVLEQFDHVLWVETGEQCSPARLLHLLAALFTHLGVEAPAFEDAEQAGFHLVRVLAGRRTLLVVDNVWSARDVAPFLLASGTAVVVVTTRNSRTCPAPSEMVRVGPMAADAVEQLVSRRLPVTHSEARVLARLCGGWPLLASVINAILRQEVKAGATPKDAIARTADTLRTVGLDAFDVWDADQRAVAIGGAMQSSLRSLEDHVTVPGGCDLAARYRSLAVFPSSTEIPLDVLRTWWTSAFDWTDIAVDQFCRVLADRSLVGAYLGDRQAIVLHDVFRSYLRRLPGEEWPELHRSLVEAHRPGAGAAWADLDGASLYLWRQLGHHLHAAGMNDELVNTLSSPRFVTEKVLRTGHHSLADDGVALATAVRQRAVRPAEPAVATALALTGAAYLLSGTRSSHDIAATLLIELSRTKDVSAGAVEELRSATGTPSTSLAVRWARTGHPDEAHAENAGKDGHIGAVTAVAVHQGLLASAGEDGTVRLWNLDSGRLRQTLRGHVGWVYALAISHLGDLLASAGDDGTIHLWNTTTGTAVAALAGHSGRVRALAFAGASHLLVSGSEDGTVRVWETERSASERVSLPIGVPVWSVATDSAGELVACTGEDATVRLYHLASAEQLDEQEAHTDWVRTVSFASSAPVLATGSGDRTVRIWDTSQHRLSPIRTVELLPARPRSVLVAGDDGSDLLIAGEDAMLRSQLATGEAVAPPPDGVDWVRSIAKTEAGHVVAGCEDGGLRLWDRSHRGDMATLAEGRNSVWSTAVMAGNQLAAIGRADDTIELCDSTTGAHQRTLSAGPGTGRQAGRVWSMDAGGSYLAAACGDGRVRVWNAAQPDPLLTLNDDQHRSWAVAVDRTGSQLAATSAGLVRLWSLPSGRPLWATQGHTGRIRAIGFDASGELLVTGGGDGLVRIWNAAAGTEIATFKRTRWVRAVAIDDAGSLLAIGFGSGQIEVIDRHTGRTLVRLPGHRGRVLMLALDADHERLVSAAADGTIRTWSLATQRQERQVRVDASLHCATFEPQNGQLLAGSARGTVALALHHNDPEPEHR